MFWKNCLSELSGLQKSKIVLDSITMTFDEIDESIDTLEAVGSESTPLVDSHQIRSL